MPRSRTYLHRIVSKRLSPWLEMAAYLPPAPERRQGILGLLDPEPPRLPPPSQAELSLMERVFQDCRHIVDDIGLFEAGTRDEKYPSDDDEQAPVYAIHLSEPIYRPHAARAFYALLFNVKLALGTIVNVAETTKGVRLGSGAIFSVLSSFSFSPRITITEWNRSEGPARILKIEDDPGWLLFKSDLSGVDIDRLRRCPHPKCHRIYYANRKNKTACDEHLAVQAATRAQQERKRKAAEYELNRRASRLAKKKGIGIGEALKLARASARAPQKKKG